MIVANNTHTIIKAMLVQHILRILTIKMLVNYNNTAYKQYYN